MCLQSTAGAAGGQTGRTSSLGFSFCLSSFLPALALLLVLVFLVGPPMLTGRRVTATQRRWG